jgi:hypothetical protein
MYIRDPIKKPAEKIVRIRQKRLQKLNFEITFKKHNFLVFAKKINKPWMKKKYFCQFPNY